MFKFKASSLFASWLQDWKKPCWGTYSYEGLLPLPPLTYVERHAYKTGYTYRQAMDIARVSDTNDVVRQIRLRDYIARQDRADILL
jgi:hypothetical protein